jgi:hypothetical protein
VGRSKAGASVEVDGGPELRRAFDKLGARAEDLAGMYGDIADMVATEASDRAPILTGTLRDSIKPRRAKKSSSVTVGIGLPYAGPIHFGWRARNIEPQPFLYEALDDQREAIEERVEREVAFLMTRFDREAPQ